jgi:hypothetical protein
MNIRNIPTEYLTFRHEDDFGFSAVDESEVTQTVDENTLETKIIRETVSTSNELISGINSKLDRIIELYNQGKLGLDVERQQLQKETSEKLIELEKMIIPLLVNLMKNSDKEYIYWPNRKDKLQEQIDKILLITRETIQ